MGINTLVARRAWLAAGGTAIVAVAVALTYALDWAGESPADGSPAPAEGETVHYAALVTTFTEGRDAPFQREPLHADIWVRADGQGEWDLVVARYYREVGSPARFVRLSREGTDVYWGSPPGGDPARCVEHDYEPFLRSPLTGFIPAVQTPRRLESEGYQRSSEPPELPQVPGVPAPDGMPSGTPRPIATDELETWNLHEEAGGFFTDHTVTIEGDAGLVVAYHVTVRNDRFEVIREFERIRGPLERFEPGALETEAFDLSEDEIAAIRTACEGA